MDVIKPIQHRPSYALDPRAKLLACALYFVCVSTVSQNHPLRLALLTGFLAACHGICRVRLGRVLRFVPSVALLVAFGILFGGQATILIVSGSKILLCVFAVSLFSKITPFSDVLSAVRALGVPPRATTLMLLAHRYVETLSAEGTRTVQAFTFHARSGHAKPLRQYAMLASSLVLRAAERSERIAIALKASGFNGELPVKALPPLRMTDAASLAAFLLVVLLVTFGRN